MSDRMRSDMSHQISKLMMGDGGKRSQASQEEEDSEPGHTEGDHISTEAGLHRCFFCI